MLSQLRQVQAIVTHLEKFPVERARAACRRASHYGSVSYRAIKNILVKALDREPLPGPMTQQIKDEVERRDAKQLDQRVRRANFEHQKTLEDFDFHFNPQVPKAKVLDLATRTYVERRENVLLLGQTGVGKSHIAQALGHRACRAGPTVLYVSAQDVLKQLHASRADNTHDKKLARLAEVDLLIIDDLGLRSLKGEEPIDLYEIVRLRYERASTIITSNRDTDELAQLLGDPLLASAAMDRLLHGAHVLRLVGDTYRNPSPAKRKNNSPLEATP